jgi:subtilisin family serine protease
MRWQRSRFRLWFACPIFFWLTFPGLSAHAQSPSEPPHVPGEILVKFREGASLSGTDLTVALMGGTRLNRFRSGVEHWRTGSGLTTEEALSGLRADRLVDWAEPNYIVRASLVPDDPLHGELWGLRNTGQLGGVPGADIEAEAAWDITVGSRDVLVGVIDTGIDYTHPDLAANIWTNPGEIPGNHVDDDFNGYVDDVHGWDFLNRDDDPMDDHDHGTHVAGTIGAVGNNAVGVAGVSWNVTLVALKILNADGYGSTAAAIEAVEYAAAMGIDVTNNSWGGGGYSQALLEVIAAAGQGGSLFVAAAGNDSVNMDYQPSFPAAYTEPSIVSVAATDPVDGLAWFSNYGPTSVDLGAPGDSILSTLPGSTYERFSGTSMAAPHVTGVAALLRAIRPGIPVAALKRALLDFTDLLPSLAGRTVTGGRLNAYRSLASLDTVPPGPIQDLVLLEPTSNTLVISWTATGDDGHTGLAAAYDVRYATEPLDESNWDVAARAPGTPEPGLPGSRETMELTGLPASTAWHVGVKAVDDAGNAGPLGSTLMGTTLGPPTMSTTPQDFSLSLFTGEIATRALTVSNIGTGTLDWSIPPPDVGGGLSSPGEVMDLAKGETDPRPGTGGDIGPDASGYRVLRSDEPGGPEFAWRDISGSGLPLEELDNDDEISAPIDLGFDFPYYGVRFNAVRVSTNGFLSFTSVGAPYTNQPLPQPASPGNLLAPFWDDLDLSRGGSVYVARDDGAFMVQFDHVRPLSGAGDYTFQVTLNAAGEILFQYLSMSGEVDRATVGIQDASGATGLQACFNSGCVNDGQALLINAVPQWLAALPASGRLHGGESQEVTVTVDASGLAGGTYTGMVDVESNDPLNSSAPHPVVLTVTDAPAMAVAPDALDFGTVFLGHTWSRNLTLLNAGTLPLAVDITAGDAALTADISTLMLAAGQQAMVRVTLAPISAGPFTGAITLTSNAPNAPTFVIPVTATAAPAPGVSVSPASFSEHLLTGGSVTRTMTITNTGGSDLDVRLLVEPPADPARLTVSPDEALVPPGEGRNFTVAFHAGRSGTAVYGASVRIETNVPDTPVVAVPAMISVTAAPNISVSGEPITVSSTLPYTGVGASTWHNLTLPVPPEADASLRVWVNGDYGFPGETATVSAEGRFIGMVGGESTYDCGPAEDTFPLPASDLALLAADGVVNVEVRNGVHVDDYCSTREHHVDLSYEAPTAMLDFGGVFVTASRSIRIHVSNVGLDTLTVSAVTTDHAEFMLSPSSLSLAPGRSEQVTITFSPSAAGLLESMLRIHSNDADTPSHEIPLSGLGLIPPVIDVTPPSIASSLMAGGQEPRQLVVTNMGGSDLELVFGARMVTQAGTIRSAFTGLSRGDPAASNNGAGAVEAPAPEDESWVDAAGDFSRLASSPVPLTCVVGDTQSGVLYAQADRGTSFYRYRAGEDRWEPLAPAPVPASYNGGAALLNGKVYTSYPGSAFLGVYDIASEGWTTIVSPLPFTANIASDGTRFLYLVRDRSFVRFDPLTAAKTGLQPTPFSFTAWGGLRHHNGVLYGHQGNGQRGFAAFNIANNSWWVLPAVPAGAVLGAEMDPLAGDYYVYGPYQGTNLYRYSIGEGLWTVSSIPFFPVSDGGMAWFPLPGGGVVFVQGEYGTGVAHLGTGSSFIRLGRTTGVVPPSASSVLDFTIDASALVGGQYAAEIVIASNDPLRPEVVVPVTLGVTGVPSIHLGGIRGTAESVEDFVVEGAFTAHRLPVVAGALSGTVEVIADGDYGEAGEYAAVTAEAEVLGTVRSDAGDCTPASGLFNLGNLAALSADGIVEVTVRNTIPVHPICSTNRHTVRLSYEVPTDPINFGGILVGLQRDVTFLISNTGTDTLHVGAITSSLPDFVISAGSFDLAPQASRSVTVSFRPVAVGPASATLTIVSNDPASPTMSIPLTGIGLEPPIIGVDPARLDASLLHGQQETRQIVVSNSGGSSLEFGLAMRWKPHVEQPGSPFRGLSEVDPAAWDNQGDLPSPAGSSNGEGYLGIAGDFDLLAPSPEPLTCVVEDRDTGVLYGQANGGRGFYRYDPRADAWQPLASAPVSSGNNGGAALLNGKIYTTYVDQAIMGVYDIASDSWFHFPNPLPYTGNIASDGAQYLYLAGGSTMVRFDPATSSRTTLPPPFYVQPWAGLRHLSGVLYVHQGAGSGSFAAFDTASNLWTSLPSMPAGAVLGAAIDPFGRHVYAYGSYGGRNLYRYSIDDGVWSVASIPFFSVTDGGMGWLSSPLPALYFIQGENGNGFARLITGTGFVRLPAPSGVVPPSGSLAVDITLDTTGLLGGVYEADLLVSSNAPASPELIVPVSLRVIGRPILRLSGERVTVESSRSWVGPVATTSHSLALRVPPGGSGTLSVTVEGDFGDPTEFVSVSTEGTTLGSVVGYGYDCRTLSGWFQVPAEQLLALAADGTVQVAVQNSPGVDDSCGESRHKVHLAYEGSVDRLDFGDVLIGKMLARTVLLTNSGTEVLHVSSISSDDADFSASASSFALAPGLSRAITVMFHPSAAGTRSGTLTIVSDDMERPAVGIPVTGTGLEPPVIAVAPDSLNLTLPPGDAMSRTLTISNNGGSPLRFTLEVLFEGAQAQEVTAAAPGGSGVIEPLAPSPVPLTAVVEDRAARILYAQAAQSHAFYRYLAESNTWETLASAAHWGTVGGAALLNGKVYTHLIGSPFLGIYDIASDSWAVRPIPLGYHGNIASDGTRYLYLVYGSSLIRYDPDALATTTLMPPPFNVDRAAGIRHHQGVLYVHQGGGNRGFASYDIAANRWTTLASAPLGLVLGAAIDPFNREYFAYGSYDDSRLHRYSIDRGTWSSSTTPFAIHEGGMGWLSSPVAGIYFIQGKFGTSMARYLTGPDFVRIPVAGGEVAAHSSLPLEVRYSAGSLPTGTYPADIRISSNDPVTPLLTISAALTIQDRPRMTVTADPVTFESSRSYNHAGAITSHLLMPPATPAGDGTLDLLADGAFESGFQTATIFSGDLPIGGVGGTGYSCVRASGSFAVPLSALGSMIRDGVMSFEVHNSGGVGAGCPVNSHTVRMTYPLAQGRLDFLGAVGRSSTLSLRIDNTGSGPLTLSSITSTSPLFVPSASFMVVPATSTATLHITFSPPVAGAFSGVLTLESDDPDAHLVTWAVEGTALKAPVMEVVPPTVEATLASGSSETRSLALRNTGAAPLHVALNSSGQPSIVSIEPATSTVAPGATLNVSLLLETKWLTAGQYGNQILIASNDPAGDSRVVPVLLSVVGVPRLRAVSGQTTVESTLPFSPGQGSTHHRLAVPEPPGGSGSLELIANGDFLYFGRTATAQIEGSPFGSAGGGSFGIGCTTATGTSFIPWTRLSPFAADGVVDVTVHNTPLVTMPCPGSSHTVKLTYGNLLHMFDLGEAMAGAGTTRTFQIENGGTDELHVSSITSDSAAFTVSPTDVSIPVGRSADVTVTFSTPVAGAFSGTLSFVSNDPVEPVVTVPVQGLAQPPPVIQISSGSLDVTLRPPSTETKSFTISNTGEFPLSFAITGPPNGFATALPSAGVVPPSGAVEVNVLFDSSVVLPGRNQASLDIQSNDPFNPMIRLPVSLYALGWPTLSLEGPPISVERSRAWTAPGALTTHRLSLPLSPAGGGNLIVTVEGGFNGTDTTATADLESIRSLVLGGGGEGGCGSISGSMSLTPAEMMAIALDRVAIVQVQNSPQVAAVCPANRHAVSLTYVPIAEQIDFGAAFVSGAASRELVVRNTGTDVLHVSRIFSDNPWFTAEASSLTVPPEGSAAVSLHFTPLAEGESYGELHLESDDPGRPEALLILSGIGLPPPVIEVQPPSISSALVIGGEETKTLVVLNTGGSDLVFTTQTPPMSEPFFSVAPFAGTIAPDESMAISVHFTTAGVSIGSHAASLDLVSNDPRSGILTVPVSLVVTGLPDIVVSGEEVQVHSSMSYQGGGSSTAHHLVLPALPAGPGSLQVTAEGAWSDPLAQGAVSVEGTPLGVLRGSQDSSVCGAVTEIIQVSAPQLAALAADGAVDVLIENSEEIEATCPDNRHLVSLSFRRSCDRIDLGEIYPGHPVTRVLRIENRGSAFLEVDAIATDNLAIAVEPASLRLAPNEVSDISLLVTPGALGTLGGTVSIHSNDPDNPTVMAVITGSVVMPPIARLDAATLVAALPPRGTTNRTLRIINEGASDLRWLLAGPEAGGKEPLPAWIRVFPSQGTIAAGGITDVIVTLDATPLADGDHAQVISLHSNDPVNGRMDVVQSLHVGELTPEIFLIEPTSLNLASNGTTVKASIQLPSPFDPRDVVVSSVLLGGRLAPIPSRISFVDDNLDGRLELVLKFDRLAFQSMLPAGQSVTVELTGEVKDQTWFRGTARIRIIRPLLQAPASGDYLLLGEPFAVRWLAAAAAGVRYTVILSRDGGETWEYLARDLMDTSFLWVPSGATTSNGRIRVLAHDAQGVMGYDTSAGDFTVAGRLGPPHGVQTLEVRAWDGGQVGLSWSRPHVDTDHGPAASYRVLRATQVVGPFVEMGAPVTEDFTDPSPPGTHVLFYQVIAVNPAGESID